MESHLKVLHIDVSSGFYKLERFDIGEYFGPVDLGLHLAAEHGSLNFGGGLLAGSVFPGSNRLIFTGYSPCWDNFYISSMGGAALVFDNLGISLAALHGRAAKPSLLYLNRIHGEEIEVQLTPVDVDEVWGSGRGGAYSVMDTAFERFGERYKEDPRVLAVGPAARSTDIGGVVSVPIKKGEMTYVDTWAGRGGFGSQMFQRHGIVGVIYGGTYIDEDFRDRKVANEWFEKRYNKKMAVEDMEATVKYHWDDKLQTGGTLGVNYTKMGSKLLAFNYRSIYLDEDGRTELNKRLVLDHYLKQFNEDLSSVPTRDAMKHCGEPCVAVCKKMQGIYKKDYEPYQTMGPNAGVFDQRAAEKLNHHADAMGFDGISVGGVVSWLMECLDDGLLSPEELGVSSKPAFSGDGFAVETDSMHNADLGVELIDAMIQNKGKVDMSSGARKLAQRLSAEKGTKAILDRLVYTANARHGWMVPNQYLTPGVLSPMPIMGKYYNYYGDDYVPPRALGRMNVDQMKKELMLDNAGFCRFHRGWAQEMVPEIIGNLFDKQELFLGAIDCTARTISSRSAAVYWESERTVDYVHAAIKRQHEVGGQQGEDIMKWLDAFGKNKHEAAFDFWCEIQKGVHEAFRGKPV
ncbi:MAG: aldehyde ferredoxin oxidoreductase C-terminal domain-containing protein [bacterium]